MLRYISVSLYVVVFLLASKSVIASTEEASGQLECSLDSRLSVAVDIIESVRRKMPYDYGQQKCGEKSKENCCDCNKTPYVEKPTDCSKCDKECTTFVKRSHDFKPLDCSDVYRIGNLVDGTYQIWPQNRILNTSSIRVYCDMTHDGGGWTVIQRRGDFGNPADYFYKNWASYKTGFGDLNKEFWLGNDNIYAITNQRPYQLKIDMEDWNSTVKYAVYNEFWIDNESEFYKLHVNGYSGTAGDSLSYHNEKMFSTKDKDNANHTLDCPNTYSGAWWYDSCVKSNLNGLYGRISSKYDAKQASWFLFGKGYFPLYSVVMKIRQLAY